MNYKTENLKDVLNWYNDGKKIEMNLFELCDHAGGVRALFNFLLDNNILYHIKQVRFSNKQGKRIRAIKQDTIVLDRSMLDQYIEKYDSHE